MKKLIIMAILKDKRDQMIAHRMTYLAWDLECENEHKHDGRRCCLDKRINELTRLINYLKHNTMKNFIKFVNDNIGIYANIDYSNYEEEININIFVRSLL